MRWVGNVGQIGDPGKWVGTLLLDRYKPILNRAKSSRSTIKYVVSQVDSSNPFDNFEGRSWGGYGWCWTWPQAGQLHVLSDWLITSFHSEPPYALILSDIMFDYLCMGNVS